MAFASRLCLALLGLMSILLSPVNSLAVDVQPAFPNEPESNFIPIPGTDENPWPAVQPIDPPDPPVPTKVPVPTGTPFIIDTGLVVKVNAGQPFIIRLDKFLQIFRDGAKLNTSPRVSWVSLDSAHRAVIGRVPKDYPASRVFVFITGRYALNGRVIDLGYVVALDVIRSVSTSTSRSTPVPTVRPIGSSTSRSLSIHTTARTTTPRTTFRTTPRTSKTTTRTTTPHTTTPRTTLGTPTTPRTTARTNPSGLPNPTLFPREEFTIPLDPYKLSTGDIVTSFSTEPLSDWVRPNPPFNSRPTLLVGTVPAKQPPARIEVRLSLKNPATGFEYKVPFYIIVRPAPDVHTL